MTKDINRHYYNLKGKKAEQIVHKLAEKTFLTDWCFKNPEFSTKGQEFDLIVVFGDIAIIWTIANIKLKGNVKRFQRKSIDHNLIQIKGAYNKIRKVKDTINLCNPVRGSEEFDPRLIKRIYMIAVCVSAGKIPFCPIEMYDGRLIHIFDEISLAIILYELDTIVDFCEYLEKKEKFLMNRDIQIIVNGGEEEVLAYYLYHGREFKIPAGIKKVFIDKGLWTKIRKKPEYRAKQKENIVSYAWDKMISYFHDSSVSEERSVARELANTSRLERRILAKSMLDGKNEAAERKLEQLRRYFTINNKTYVYLIVNHDMSRDYRKHMLSLTCFVARGLCKENTRVIGIATDRANSPAYAYECYVLDKPDWTKKDEEFKEKLQEEYGIFKNSRYTHHTADEYPKTKESKNE